ncbi:hypothetical protein LINPERHAP2_LOCUS22790 [Linum perenne]
MITGGIRDSAIACSFEVQTMNRQDQWIQDSEMNVLGHNSGAASRLSFSFQVRVARVSELKFRSFLVCRVSVCCWCGGDS